MTHLSKNIQNGLLLIDLQRSFTKGSWAAYFGYDQIQPIQAACEKTKMLLESDRIIRRGEDDLTNNSSVMSEISEDSWAAVLNNSYIPKDYILCTKCYLTDPSDSDFDESVKEILEKEEIPFIHKPTTNVCLNPAFHEWVRRKM